jgi:tetratricopeptide (TPR) repeat protein
MRTAALAFLLAGFGVGFGAMYPWTSRRAPDIVRPLNQRGVPDPELLNDLVENRNFDALRSMGNAQYDQRMFGAAATLYAKALEVRPDHHNTRTDLGLSLLQAGKPDDAIEEFQHVLDQDPSHPQAMFYLGLSLVEFRQDTRTAAALWRRLIETNPDFPQISIVRERLAELEKMEKQP